jgi:hypothetical protein
MSQALAQSRCGNYNFFSHPRHRYVIAHGGLRGVRTHFGQQDGTNCQFVFAEYAVVSRMCSETRDARSRPLLDKGDSLTSTTTSESARCPIQTVLTG